MARFDPISRRFLVYEKKDSPSPPPAPAVPAPSQTIAAQAAATPSTYTPYGNIVYSGDPTVPGSFRATETLSPAQNQILNQRNAIATSLLGNAGAQVGQLPTAPFQYSGLNDPTAQAMFGSEQALLDPVFQRQTTNFEQDMANKGIPLNSDAYNEAARNLQTNQNLTENQLAAQTASDSFNRALTTRQQQFNEIAQILGGNMQQQPGAVSTPNINAMQAYQLAQNAANTAYGGAINAYNQQIGANNAGLSGLFGLGAAGLNGYMLASAI